VEEALARVALADFFEQSAAAARGQGLDYAVAAAQRIADTSASDAAFAEVLQRRRNGEVEAVAGELADQAFRAAAHEAAERHRLDEARRRCLVCEKLLPTSALRDSHQRMCVLDLEHSVRRQHRLVELLERREAHKKSLESIGTVEQEAKWPTMPWGTYLVTALEKARATDRVIARQKRSFEAVRQLHGDRTKAELDMAENRSYWDAVVQDRTSQRAAEASYRDHLRDLLLLESMGAADDMQKRAVAAKYALGDDTLMQGLPAPPMPQQRQQPLAQHVHQQQQLMLMQQGGYDISPRSVGRGGAPRGYAEVGGTQYASPSHVPALPPISYAPSAAAPLWQSSVPQGGGYGSTAGGRTSYVAMS